MNSALLAIALALYFLATVTFIGYVVSAHDTLRRAAHTLLACAFGMHAASLSLQAVALGYEAIAPFQEELSFIACVMVGLYLLMALRTNLTIVGALVTPLALPPRLRNLWLPAHVAPEFVGYAVFTVAFCLSLTYLLQERQLKSKRKGSWFRRLPSLETLDELNYRFVTVGFALFTIGLITGSFLAKEAWGALWSWEPVQVWSLISWLLYAVLLHARSVGWRGRKAARLTILCFVVLAASFLGVNLVFPGKHAGTFG
jgi:ABC-type transport system involved in cytochrome c biogenesis permease subunit